MTSTLLFCNKLGGWQNTNSNLIYEILIFLQGIISHPIELHEVTPILPLASASLFRLSYPQHCKIPSLTCQSISQKHNIK